MILEASADRELIRQIITHPKIYPMVSDDGAPSGEAFQPPKLPFVLVRDGEEVLGGFLLEPQNVATVKIHTCLLPNAWGPRAKRAAEEMQQWVWANTGFVRINTDIPEYNRLAIRFARQAGMRQFGLNPKSYRKNGKLYDQLELGLSKPGA